MQHVALQPNKLHATAGDHSLLFWERESDLLAFLLFVFACPGLYWQCGDWRETQSGPRVLLGALHSSITSRAFWRQSSYKQLMPLSSSVKAASRRRPQRSQSTSYTLTSPLYWKQQAGIKAMSKQDKARWLSS